MDEMPSMRSIGETVEDYFIKAMLEQIKRPFPFTLPNATIRNEAAHQEAEIDNRCPHCGHSLDDEFDY